MAKNLPTLTVLSCLWAWACAGPMEESSGPPSSPATEPEAMTQDVHSFGRPDQVALTHGIFDWKVDFEAKKISGDVTWSLNRSETGRNEPLILDTKGLAIHRVETWRTGLQSGSPQETRFELGKPHPALGTPLVIQVPPEHNTVRIAYETGPGSAALQWLGPEQTAGGKQPFLFSQCQSILARTMLPCQDSPGVRFTYEASVTVPKELRAVMAAKQLGGGYGKPFRFRMPQPIPSYLVALAVGDIEFKYLGPRTGVYAEPSVLDKAAYEFADTEKMMTVAEKLYGPYLWERYDIIVLPPSFPFGGMENPRLTFATPTILAGDRSLVALVAHELAHSWSGNLVTNATWSDFWLNEGFTVYFERRIMEEIYGRDRSEMEAVLGRQDLLEDLGDLETGFTILHVDLEGRDPDDAFSNVPYEKGYLFLRLLEEAAGRERFDRFLRKWFTANKFTSRTTADFEAYVEKELLPGRTGELKMQEWLHEPGLPENAPIAQSDAFTRAEELASSFTAGETRASELPGKEWTTHEWLHFLRSLPSILPLEEMTALDKAWNLTTTGNSEILMQWLLQCIRTGYAKANPALKSFLQSQGRRKFLKPLYTELAKTEAGKKFALEIYETARPLYHAISSNTIDGILDYGKKDD